MLLGFIRYKINLVNRNSKALTCCRSFSSSHRVYIPNIMGSEISVPGIPPPSKCRIVVVGPKNGDASLAELSNLPKEARIIATGSTIDELRRDGELFTEANVLLNITGTGATLGPILSEMPFLTWFHSSHAGLDSAICPELKAIPDLVVTNAKGVFSSSLAEYVMGACLYFAKDFARLDKQREAHRWEKFDMKVLKGQTMGIVGYGDIGRATAQIARAFGMKIVALRRNPDLSAGDPLIDQCLGFSGLGQIMTQSDYLVCALPLTDATRNIFNGEVFAQAKCGQVFINIGRGAVVHDESLIAALGSDGRLRGAALDVFSPEPLLETSPYWGMSNLLLSPHNADQTETFRHDTVRFFTEQCKKFVAGEDLESVVNIMEGY